MTIKQWKIRNSSAKSYTHFDKRVALKDVWYYISDPNKVAHHGFYPFISYQKHFNKYSKKEGIKLKKRELCYAAHIDRYIFSYYGHLLNEKYNQRVMQDGISDSAVAYRSDLGKCNINFAKTVLEFIQNHAFCYIIIGDFTKFFDYLDHKYLKKQICNLLACTSLPSDYYAVFKNITKYAKWCLKDLLQLNGLSNTRAGIRELNSKERKHVLSPEQFKKEKGSYIEPNINNFGIPQGSPISAVLSNIYMLDFDKQLKNSINKHNGLYMRYSDDFIIILPTNNNYVLLQSRSYLQDLVTNTPGLDLQEEKTQIYFYSLKKLENITPQYLGNYTKSKNLLHYLGFTFDGSKITIRDKTISKYYYRMYRKAKHVVNSSKYTKKGNRISNKNLYELYSEKGANKGKGNFITYVQRSIIIFGEDTAIDKGTKRHMQKIKRKLTKS